MGHSGRAESDEPRRAGKLFREWAEGCRAFVILVPNAGLLFARVRVFRGCGGKAPEAALRTGWRSTLFPLSPDFDRPSMCRGPVQPWGSLREGPSIDTVWQKCRTRPRRASTICGLPRKLGHSSYERFVVMMVGLRRYRSSMSLKKIFACSGLTLT